VHSDAPHRAGLGTALLSMRPGERALVRVGSGGAYGAGGNFSFPAVAPHSDLLYDVHLLAVQRAETHAVRVRWDAEALAERLVIPPPGFCRREATCCGRSAWWRLGGVATQATRHWHQETRALR